MNRNLPSIAASILLAICAVCAADGNKRPGREVASFGTLKATAPDAARAAAESWLKSTGKTDQSTAFAAIWDSDRSVLDRVTDTLVLGDAAAAKLLAEAKDADAPAPQAIAAVLKDSSKPTFYRANLALAYAKALANRKVYEEALEVLKTCRAEDVVDPGSYYFTRAVAEHALMLKAESASSIGRLLDDVAELPERYRMVSTLMLLDMMTWQEKDLGWIARKMDNIHRRLDLARGGKKTQKMQKEVLARLDEMIKQMENQQKGGGGQLQDVPNSGPKQDGQNPNQGPNPLQDSNVGGRSGPGQVDPKRVKELAEVWGKLPEKERAKALVGLTRDLDPRYREAIEAYFKKLATSSDNSK